MGQTGNKGSIIKEDGTIVRDTTSSKIIQMKKKPSSDGNNRDNKSNKKGGIIALLISAIVLYSVAYLIRDKYENLGNFLFLVSCLPFMLFAFEVVSNKKLGMAICIIGWFVMLFSWSDYVQKPTQSVLPALEILGICSFFAFVAYLGMYQEENGSSLSKDDKNDNSYLNEVVMAVCIGGDCYSKYEQNVISYFGDETNEKTLRFLNKLDIWHMMLDGGRKRVTEKFKRSLTHLGKDVGLDDKTIKEIVEWQQKRLSHVGDGILLLVVIATNSSMKEVTPLLITKKEFIVNEIRNLISHFKGYKYDYWNNLTLSIINYDAFANNYMWPTHLQNIDENIIDIKATDENAVRISEGLESALRIAQTHAGQTYLVLVSDGQDDDVEKTKKVIDTIIHKTSIEFYTFFVDSLTRQNVNMTKRSAFGLLGGIPLPIPFVKSLDWWITRDVTLHPWYEHEEMYTTQRLKMSTNNG